MRPTIFRWSDLSFMWIPTLIVVAIVSAIIWNLVSPSGEALPFPAWFVSSITVASCIGIAVAFYWQRWSWVRRYAGTIRGINIYYQDKAAHYLNVDLEAAVDRMLQKWATYLNDKINLIVVAGVDCIFRPEEHWNQAEMGWWSREVTGLSGDNWVMVGQGGRPVADTAFAHEVSHIILNRRLGKTVEEAEAHAILAKVGV